MVSIHFPSSVSLSTTKNPGSYSMCVCVSCSVISNSATPWTTAHQAPVSMGFSRQEYCSGLPFPSPGDLPNPRTEPRSPALWTDLYSLNYPGSYLIGNDKRILKVGKVEGRLAGILKSWENNVLSSLSFFIFHIPWTEHQRGTPCGITNRLRQNKQMKNPKSILLSLAKVQEKENRTETNKKFQPPLYNPGFLQTVQSTGCSKALDAPGSWFKLRYRQVLRSTAAAAAASLVSLASARWHMETRTHQLLPHSQRLPSSRVSKQNNN